MPSSSGENTFDVSAWSVYSGYIKNTDAIYQVSSGGAATALAQCIIDRGGVVFGAVYSQDFKSAHFACAETLDELGQFKTSKYIATQKMMLVDGKCLSVFGEVAKKLNIGKTVLFIGLGCDIGALLAYLAKQRIATVNLFTLDLICHGPTYAKVQEDYINTLEKKISGKITSFSVRYKKLGWEPPFIHAEFDNGKVFDERFYESDLGFAFKAFSCAGCYNCQFKGDHHKADLTVGDYWGCTKKMDCYNPLGVSVLLNRTEKGQKLIKMLSSSGDFILFPGEINLILERNTTFFMSRKRDDTQYFRFKSDFEKHGLHYAVINSEGYQLHRKNILKRKIKSMLPVPVVELLQFIKRKVVHGAG